MRGALNDKLGVRDLMMEKQPCIKSIAQQQGYHAENYACQYLQTAGLLLLTRNFRCKYGEIDLIMRDNDTIVFIEVRYRQQQYYGSPIETITLQKQQRIRRAAQTYLLQYDKAQKYFWRYDWLGLNALPQIGHFNVEWIQNAWEEDY
jgi:putative endonuclease